MDTNMYERQDGTGLEIGSYAHRPILHDPAEIPSIEESALSPTEFPFTQDDFELQMEQALELMPEIVGDESVGIKYAINGLLSLTPDGLPLLGETPEVKGLWSAAAVWMKEGPGVGRAVAEWMTHGEPRDRSAVVRHRALLCLPEDDDQRERPRGRGVQQDLRHRPSGRAVGVQPRRPADAVPRREKELGAVFFETAGWERPHWYESNAGLVERVRRSLRARPSGTTAGGRRSSTPSTWRCASARRCSTSPRSASSTSPAPARWTTVQQVAMRQMDVPIGRTVYTPLLTPGGGFRSDLTILRLADDRFRFVTGGAARHGRSQVGADHAAEGGAVTDLTSAWTTLGLWGPRARDILASVTADDVSHEGFPFARSRHIEIGPAAGAGDPHLLRRRPRLGAARADRAGRAPVGPVVGGRAAARR